MRPGSAGWVARPHTVALGRAGSDKRSHVWPASFERSTVPVSPVVVSPHPAKSTCGSSGFTARPRAYGSGHLVFTPIGGHDSPRSALQNTSPFVLPPPPAPPLPPTPTSSTPTSPHPPP